MRIPGGRRKSAMRRPDGPGRLMVGFEGEAVPPRRARWLRGGTVCGVVLFSRNVEAPRQVRDLCREIRAAAGRGRPAPLVAIDQEGGGGTRLGAGGVSRVPPPRRAIRAGIPALMTAHVLFPALDREFPATLSEKILGGLLRKQLRFRGTVVSDSLEMKAITGRFGIGAAAVRAVSAGCDIVLVGRGGEGQEGAAEGVARARAG